ncbi:MAG: hypothetical protein CSA76_00525 [Spirochaetales bacterium]|nr:MAG: hypothetical protein CSA76_00525 [Spirochaetales bacterium]
MFCAAKHRQPRKARPGRRFKEQRPGHARKWLEKAIKAACGIDVFPVNKLLSSCFGDTNRQLDGYPVYVLSWPGL